MSSKKSDLKKNVPYLSAERHLKNTKNKHIKYYVYHNGTSTYPYSFDTKKWIWYDKYNHIQYDGDYNIRPQTEDLYRMMGNCCQLNKKISFLVRLKYLLEILTTNLSTTNNNGYEIGKDLYYNISIWNNL